MSDLNVYTTSQINALTPITGDMVVDSDLNAVKLYDGAAWRVFNTDSVVEFENRWGASFDGSSDYLSVTQNSAINISGDITLSAWVNRTSTTSYNAIFTKRQVGSSMNYQLTIDNSNGRVGLGHSGGAWVYNTTTTLSTSTWYHVAVTVSSGTAQFYIDGVAEDSFTGISITATTQDLIIGATINYNYFGGKIDEAALWDCALSEPDITKIYNGTAPNGKPAYLKLAGSYDTDRTANLKGYWRMGDDSNDSPSSDPSSNKIVTITDSSGNGNDATQSVANNQPTFKALDQSTTSLSFDGSDDYVDCGVISGLQGSSNGAISVWIKPDNAGHAPNIGYRPEKNHQFVLTFVGGILYFGVRNGSEANIYSTTALPNDTSWHHYLATFNNGTAKIYIDGLEVSGTQTGTNPSTLSSTSDSGSFFIGRNGADNKYTDGLLDEAAIFNTALSASEVSSLAASRGAHVVNDLSLSPVAYYRMGEDDSLTDGQTGISQITDASGNGNHATQSVAANQPTASVSPVIYV